MKKVSILIPVYNAEKYIKSSVFSIVNQSYRDIEILLCDDCSTDNTWEIVNECFSNNERITIFKNKENLGYLNTCNFLAQQATGHYITFQDADDISTPDRIDKLVKFIQERDLDIVGSYCYLFEKEEKILSTIKYPIEHTEIIESFKSLPHPPFCGSAVLTSKKIVEKHGLYDPKFDRIGCEDYDWLYRLALHKYKMGNVPESLYGYRQHSQGVSKTNYKKNILSLYSGYIAKDLYLESLKENPKKDFNYFSELYLKQHEIDPEIIYYKELLNSFYLKGFKVKFYYLIKFYNSTSFSLRKFKFILNSISNLLLGFYLTEKLKGFFR